MSRISVLLGVAGASVVLGLVVRGGPDAATGSRRGFVWRGEPPGEALWLASWGAKPSATPSVVDRGTTCPSDMVEVKGDYCPYVEQRCLRWVDPEGPQRLRCAEFAATRACTMKTTPRHFCVDKYEWPNKVGETPLVAIDWYYAKDHCEALGKRLCLDSEWTVACEGQERLPYPYGYTRNAEVCNIDKIWRNVNFQAYANMQTRDAEVARLDQREPSGSREACVSPYGVHDMTGNVDEWVVNESGRPFKSGLKGGYWGPVRTRCRPMTTAHEEKFSFYQVGFRCCADVPPARAAEGARAGGSVAKLGPAM